jgi:hypothetical protein
MKFTQPIVFATVVLAASAVALPMSNEKLDMRAVADSNVVMQRSPGIFSKIGGVVKGFLGFKREGGQFDLNARSITDDEIYARSFEEQIYARYVEEEALTQRSPGIFSKIGGVVKGFLGFKRELGDSSELATRSPGIFSKIGGVVKGFLGFKREQPNVDLPARETAIVERSPGIFSKIGGVVKGFLGFKREEPLVVRSEETDLFERSDEELYERDFEVEY